MARRYQRETGYANLAALIANLDDETLKLNGWQKKSESSSQSAEPVAEKRRNNDYEDQEMIKFCTMTKDICSQYPDADKWFHPPNGGSRDAATGAKLKRMGVRKGIPDVLFLQPRGEYNFFVADMKWGDNVLTPEQKAWFSMFSRAGALCVVAYSAGEMFDLFIGYLNSAEPAILALPE